MEATTATPTLTLIPENERVLRFSEFLFLRHVDVPHAAYEFSRPSSQIRDARSITDWIDEHGPLQKHTFADALHIPSEFDVDVPDIYYADELKAVFDDDQSTSFTPR